MGYTHYWYLGRGKTGKLSNGCVKVLREIIAKYRNILAYEYNNLNAAPVVTANLVSFNGREEEGHETFHFQYPGRPSRWETDAKKVFSFCKTARKPYDAAVCECLIAIKADLGKKIEVSSDGINNGMLDEEWRGPVAAMRARGYEVYAFGSTLDAKKPIAVSSHARSGRRVRPHRRRNHHPAMGARRRYLLGDNAD